MQEQAWGEAELIMKHWMNGESHRPGSTLQELLVCLLEETVSGATGSNG